MSLLSRRLARTISCHAWNSDATELALSPGNNEIWIYGNCQDPNPAKWERRHVLRDDRNAFVWSFNAAENKWEPELVVLRFKRAATRCKWSPSGTKFAVASAGKSVNICHWEPTGNWWIVAGEGNISKPHRSTVLSVAWHPNNSIIATAGCDYRVQAFAAHLPEVDAPAQGGASTAATILSHEAGPFGAPKPAGKAYATLPKVGTWVNDVAWSPDGTTLAYVAQDCSVAFARFSPGSEETIDVLRHSGLPFQTLLFLSNQCLVAGGHGRNPVLFVCPDSAWRELGGVEQADSGSTDKDAKADKSSFASARALFAAKTTRGQTVEAKAADKLHTTHEGAILTLQKLPVDTASAAGASEFVPSPRFSSSGMDGKVAVWDLRETSVPGLDLSAVGLA